MSVILLLCFLEGCAYIHIPLQITYEFDTFVVMKTPRALVDNPNIDHRQIARTLYQNYSDEFDWIVVIYNVSTEQQKWTVLKTKGRCHLVRNGIKGDGVKDFDIGKHFGSRANLKGIIELPTKEPLIKGYILHEIMHTWVADVSVLPTDYPSHWGFSSVHGKLGGFDTDTLENVRENIYSVGSFSPTGSSIHREGYSELELYLAGWISKDEVPDILVAENVKWPVQVENENYWFPGFIENFEASSITTWTIEQIIDRIGERIPSVENSQKHFRMATVVIENDNFPFVREDIVYFQRQIDLFSQQESILPLEESAGKFHNFWDATGGRATISAEMASAKK